MAAIPFSNLRKVFLLLSMLFFLAPVALAVPFSPESGSGATDFVLPASLAASIAIPLLLAYKGRKYLVKVSWEDMKQMYAPKRTYQNFLSSIRRAVRSTVSRLSRAVRSVARTVTRTVSSVARTVSRAASAARTVASRIVSTASRAVRSVGRAISNAASRAVSTARSIVSRAGSAVRSVARRVYSGARTVARAYVNTHVRAAQTVASAIGAVKKSVQSSISRIVNRASTVVKNIASKISSGLKAAKQVGKALVNKVKKDMAAAGSFIYKGMRDAKNLAIAAGKTVVDSAKAVGQWIVEHPYETIMIIGMIALALTGVGLIADFAVAGSISLGAIGASSTGAMLGTAGSTLFIASDVALGGVFAADVGTAYMDGGWEAAKTVMAEKGPMVAVTMVGYGAGAALRPVAQMIARTRIGGKIGAEVGTILARSQGYTDDIIRNIDGGVPRIAELEAKGLKAKDVKRIMDIENGVIDPGYSKAVMNKLSAEELVGLERAKLKPHQIEEMGKLKFKAKITGSVKKAEIDGAIKSLKRIDKDPALVNKMNKAGVKDITMKQFKGNNAKIPARINAKGEMELNSRLINDYNPKALVSHEAQHLIDNAAFKGRYNPNKVKRNLIKMTKMSDDEADNIINIAEDIIADSRIPKKYAMSLVKSELNAWEKGLVSPDKKILAKYYAIVRNRASPKDILKGEETGKFLSRVDEIVSKRGLNKGDPHFTEKVGRMGELYSVRSQRVLSKVEQKTMTNADQIEFVKNLDDITLFVEKSFP
ncbi:MAG: hypothetical protein ACE5J7_03655 [Candidatus Aenigmatarchaeota archaeon]